MDDVKEDYEKENEKVINIIIDLKNIRYGDYDNVNCLFFVLKLW